MRGPLLVVLLALLACHHGQRASATMVPNPGHPPTYSITCKRQVECFERAAAVCPNGYSPISSGVEVNRNEGAQALENYSAKLQNRTPNSYAQIDGTVLVQCDVPPSSASAH